VPVRGRRAKKRFCQIFVTDRQGNTGDGGAIFPLIHTPVLVIRAKPVHEMSVQPPATGPGAANSRFSLITGAANPHPIYTFFGQTLY
jgi:hypothetical protein